MAKLTGLCWFLQPMRLLAQHLNSLAQRLLAYLFTYLFTYLLTYERTNERMTDSSNHLHTKNYPRLIMIEIRFIWTEMAESRSKSSGGLTPPEQLALTYMEMVSPRYSCWVNWHCIRIRLSVQTGIIWMTVVCFFPQR